MLILTLRMHELRIDRGLDVCAVPEFPCRYYLLFERSAYSRAYLPHRDWCDRGCYNRLLHVWRTES